MGLLLSALRPPVCRAVGARRARDFPSIVPDDSRVIAVGAATVSAGARLDSDYGSDPVGGKTRRLRSTRMTIPMSRRRLVLAILLADRARLFAALAFVAFFFLVIGIVAFAAALLPFGSGPSLAIPLVIFFGLPYGAIVFETLTSLRRSALRDRAIHINDDAAGPLGGFVTETARRVSAPLPKRIWVSHGFDLSVVPRGRDYDLLIGLALLDVLTADEFGALLSLSLARSFGGDSLTARAYRRIQGWIDVALAEPKGISIGAGIAKVVALACLGFLRADV